MTLAVWPEQLPLPEQSGYAIQHVSPLQRTEMVSGRARQRRIYTSVPSMVAVQFFCTELQAMAFEAWFRDAITDGADWFLCTLKTPIGLKKYEARFSGIYEGPVLVAFNNWTFSATIEIREREIMTAGWGLFPQFITNSKIIDGALNREWPKI